MCSSERRTRGVGPSLGVWIILLGAVDREASCEEGKRCNKPGKAATSIAPSAIFIRPLPWPLPLTYPRAIKQSSGDEPARKILF